jgi:hypothetical protein
MTILRIVRRCAYYTGICAILMLAMSTSNARRFTPVAVDDPSPGDPAIEANSGETIHINVLANDERLDDGGLKLIVGTPTEFGGLAEEAQPDLDVAALHVHYTSAAGFGGTDTFTYVIEDIHGDTSQPATVTILVDGSIAVTQQSGLNKVVFGGAAYPGSNVPLSAVGEFAETAGTSETRCCTVRDPRVVAGTFQSGPFDLGAALSSPMLADADCADMPTPDAGTLIVPRYFGVHTEDLGSTNPEDYRFGVCVVDTTVEWDGPVQVDIVAEPVVGYAVNCKTPPTVDKQPLTLGLSTDPAEFTSPEMRAITSECDPRGVTRWSTWYFVVNAVHLTGQQDSRTYVSRMAFLLKTMIETMREEGVADSEFLNDVKTLVLNAQAAIGSKKWTQAEAISAMATLDNATLLALTPPGDDTYSPTTNFSNPKGELVSHLAALRYAVCSEFAHPGNLGLCTMNDMVDGALPELP